ncbi:MAG: hypothetical protein JSS66_05065 [Armatimonadetes bacterium]|nr:hypothetical protein [Armatimonadota bacterium]
MTEHEVLQSVASDLVSAANLLDAEGRFAAADSLERLAERVVEAQYGGGMAEYVGRLLELAKNKGIDYMQQRMSESRIVVLNDGTPILKQNDPKTFVAAVVAQAKKLGLPDSKGLEPFAPNKFEPKWSADSAKRGEDIASGKSKWLGQAKPYGDMMADQKLHKYKWQPTSGTETKKPAPKPTVQESTYYPGPQQSNPKPSTFTQKTLKLTKPARPSGVDGNTDDIVTRPVKSPPVNLRRKDVME